MPPIGPVRLELKDLDAVLARARDERWSQLALVGPMFRFDHARRLVDKGWPAERVFTLNGPLGQIPAGAPSIKQLVALISVQPIGDAGATARAGLGVLFFAHMRRLDPDLGLMRLILPLGLAGIPLLLGVGHSLQIVVSDGAQPAWLSWQTTSGLVSVVAWAVALIALTVAWVVDRRGQR
jgi:hypothetical protein